MDECGKSLTNIVPRNNEVLIKMSFKESLFNIVTGKPNKDSDEKVTYTVAGFGPLVKDLELGEEVIMKIVTQYDDVPIKGNTKCIRELIKFYAPESKNVTRAELTALQADPKTNKIDVVQYGMFPDFQIKAHIIE